MFVVARNTNFCKVTADTFRVQILRNENYSLTYFNSNLIIL